MACSIEGIQPEFVPPGLLCSDSYCDQLAELLVNESALDELWRAQGFPTPPTTPQRPYTPHDSPRVYTAHDDMEDDSESDSGQDLPMLNELILLAYGEEVLTSNPIAVPSLTTARRAGTSSSSYLQESLIQDCMWSSHLCDNRSRKQPPSLSATTPTSSLQNTPGDSGVGGGGGVYTPAPSPPPSATMVVGGDGSSSHDDEGMESDCCVSPSVVFPSILTSPTKHLATGVGSKVDSAPNNTVTTETAETSNTATTSSTKTLSSVLRNSKAEQDDPDWEESGDEGGRHGYSERTQHRRKRKLSSGATGGGTTGPNSRVQPQSMESSTSDEEIDVVTVTSADRSKAPRKRSHPSSSSSSSSSSVSAPCSRQTSPQPKRRKYHTKRLQRLSSAGSTVGESVESEDEARRASHNVLERKRRNDLKSSFQRLREEIPELEDNQRAPKVTILRKAMEYIRHMQEMEQVSEAELVAERRRKARLLERLNQLRTCCA